MHDIYISLRVSYFENVYWVYNCYVYLSWPFG